MMRMKKNLLMLCVLLLGLLLLGGCVPQPLTTPVTNQEPLPATDEPLVDDPIMADTTPIISVDTGTLAVGFWVDTVPAVSAEEDAPYWAVLPEYARATLDGYVISSHLMQPQLFVYPLDALVSTNEGAAMMAATLQSYLDDPQESETLPLLPLFNAAQVLHTQVQMVEFQNGRGVRYVTFLSQGIVPVNNYELIYTFQGLTEDGKYYVAAILPMTHPSLPADGMVTGNEPAEFTSDFQDILPMLLARWANNPQIASCLI